jgi:PPOX class probable F420-dependent enzyme
MQRDQLRALRKSKYVSLTTFRRDGRAVATPVWFVIDGDHLFVQTASSSGKVKRIRHTPRITVAACTGRGKLVGPVVDATARVLPDGAGSQIEPLFNRRYPMAKPVIASLNRLVRLIRRRPAESSVYLQIA